MIILKYALIYISIILGSSSIAIMLKKKIESCIILDMFIKMIVLYIFGLLGILEIGVYVVLYLPIIFGIILLIKNIKNGDIKSHILTPGMIFFTILYFVLQLYPIEYRSSKLKEILPKDAKVYVVHQNCDRDASMFKLRYFIMPDININITEKLTQELENRYVLKGKDLKEEWLKILRNGYEYLYIIESDEYFEEFAKEEFISQINKNTLYKINKDENEKITIELMESL